MRTFTRRQDGLTLVEMLVGMLLSMLAVVAMLTLSRTATRTMAESRVGADVEGSIAAGLLSADRLLKSAGYFAPPASGVLVTPTYPADLVLIDKAMVATGGNAGIAMSTPPASGGVLRPTVGFGQAVLWRNRSASGVFSYEGLYAPVEGGVWRITGSSMSIAGWVKQELLLRSPGVGSAPLSDAGKTTIALRHEATACRPFGFAAAGGRYSVVLSSRAVSAGQSVDSQSCLVNFP